ncbi:MAG: hypothetical protein Q8M21_06680 [Methylococcaceae bacterium]|jgi:hypothetical protein|nr:hypothetical protein [Methylococcaceae bacterium]
MSFYDIDENSKICRASQLLAKDLDGAKQFEKVSTYAPGPVGEDEMLARSLEYPDKFNPSGGLNDSFFGDAFTHGASVQRLIEGWDVMASGVHNAFEERAASKRQGSERRTPKLDNIYIGSFHMTAGELRAVQLEMEGRRRVRVYDAGMDESDPNHAEILANGEGLEKVLKHKFRVMLMVLAQKRGLYISPFLSEEGHGRARESGCNLNYYPENLYLS